MIILSFHLVVFILNYVYPFELLNVFIRFVFALRFTEIRGWPEEKRLKNTFEHVSSARARK